MKHKTILITGGAGFIGSHLVWELQKNEKLTIVIFDKLAPPEEFLHTPNIIYFQGDITNKKHLNKLFQTYSPFEVVFHLGSEMPNKLANDNRMWKTNVIGTDHLAYLAANNKTRSFIFTSSNVTYGIPASLPVTEETPTNPLEIYGKSKRGAELVLEKYKKDMNIQIFRCPVVTGKGRLGLQAILYEFISENKAIYTLGNGDNRYQFVDVEDVVHALILAQKIKGYDIYTIGADVVMSLNQLYSAVIKHAKSSSTIRYLPKHLAFFVLWLMDKINYSPLGIYQITMMSRSIYADTTKIKTKLNWIPKKTNLDTFIENYDWYLSNKGTFKEMGGLKDSPNRSVPKLGIIRLLKFFS